MIWTILNFLAGVFAVYAFVLEISKPRYSRIGALLLGVVAVVNLVEAVFHVF